MARPKADGEAAGGGETQADLVRAALAGLGPRAKPRAIQEFIKEKFGREVTRGIISNYKSTMKKKGSLAGARRGPGRPRASAAPASGGTVRLDDLEAVRGLVTRIGAEQVVRLVKVLG